MAGPFLQAHNFTLRFAEDFQRKLQWMHRKQSLLYDGRLWKAQVCRAYEVAPLDKAHRLQNS